jgi:glycosyltransferase involved in cell wall biosynthesis
MAGISVIIPSYNRVSFLERALRSVAAQSLACDEIIVVDDGSTDDTAACVKSFAHQNIALIQYIYQDNQGPAAARNKGIAAATCERIAFLDSDDHWHKDKLKLQCAALDKNPDFLISHTGESWLRRGQHLNQKKIHQPGHGDIFDHCLRICAVGMSTVMLNKTLFDTIGSFNEEFRCCEDYDLWIRVSSQHPFLLVDKALTIKEGGREDQVSFTFRVGMDRFRIAAIASLLQEGALSSSQVTCALKEIQRKCTLYGKGCVKHGRREEAEQYSKLGIWATQCLMNDPLQQHAIPPALYPKTPTTTLSP